jgi:hypothetical protein
MEKEKAVDLGQMIFSELAEQTHSIELCNRFTRPLLYTIRNESVFFEVIPSQTSLDEKTSQEDIVYEVSQFGSTHSLQVKINMQRLEEFRDTILREKYVEEHFSIYNRSQLSEHYIISLRLTTQPNKLFYTGAKMIMKSKLEEIMIEFIIEFEKFFQPFSKKADYKDLLIATRSPFYDNIYFDYHYIVDQLVYYGLKGSVGHFAFQLADLLFK